MFPKASLLVNRVKKIVRQITLRWVYFILRKLSGMLSGLHSMYYESYFKYKLMRALLFYIIYR